MRVRMGVFGWMVAVIVLVAAFVMPVQALEFDTAYLAGDSTVATTSTALREGDFATLTYWRSSGATLSTDATFSGVGSVWQELALDNSDRGLRCKLSGTATITTDSLFIAYGSTNGSGGTEVKSLGATDDGAFKAEFYLDGTSKELAIYTNDASGASVIDDLVLAVYDTQYDAIQAVNGDVIFFALGFKDTNPDIGTRADPDTLVQGQSLNVNVGKIVVTAFAANAWGL